MLLTFLSVVAFGAFEARFTRFGLARFPAVFGLPAAVDEATLEQILDAAPIAGRYLAAVGIISALIQGGLIRRLVPKYGEPTLAVVGPFFLALALIVVGLGGTLQSWSLVIVGCVLLPVGFGLNNPALIGLVSRASPHDEQGSFLGINQSISSLARMTGPPLAGALFSAYGAQSPFYAGAGLLFLAVLIAARYRKRFGASFSASRAP
jgi:predicted MFS family arabinose efflux permease